MFELTAGDVINHKIIQRLSSKVEANKENSQMLRRCFHVDSLYVIVQFPLCSSWPGCMLRLAKENKLQEEAVKGRDARIPAPRLVRNPKRVTLRAHGPRTTARPKRPNAGSTWGGLGLLLRKQEHTLHPLFFPLFACHMTYPLSQVALCQAAHPTSEVRLSNLRSKATPY